MPARQSAPCKPSSSSSLVAGSWRALLRRRSRARVAVLRPVALQFLANEESLPACMHACMHDRKAALLCLSRGRKGNLTAASSSACTTAELLSLHRGRSAVAPLDAFRAVPGTIGGRSGLERLGTLNRSTAHCGHEAPTAGTRDGSMLAAVTLLLALSETVEPLGAAAKLGYSAAVATANLQVRRSLHGLEDKRGHAHGGCAAFQPGVRIEANATDIESIVQMVATQQCSIDEVGPLDVKDGRAFLPERVHFTGLVVLSPRTWEQLPEGATLNLSFDMGGGEQLGSDHHDFKGTHHLMLMPTAAQGPELQAPMREVGVIGRLSREHQCAGRGGRDPMKLCADELRNSLRLRDVMGWPSPLAAGCAVSQGGVPKEGAKAANCSVVQLLEVQERRLSDDKLQQALAQGEQLLPRCRKLGYGMIRCHLERLLSSLAHFEQLTEGGFHRIGLFEHLLVDLDVPNTCHRFKPGQLCFSAWDGGAAVCDTDHVDRMYVHEVKDGRVQRVSKARKSLESSESEQDLPSTATAMEWWLEGNVWSVEGKQRGNGPPVYDLPCSFVATFVRPLIPLLPKLGDLVKEVESRHTALESVYRSLTGEEGDLSIQHGPFVPPPAAANVTAIRQMSFACMRRQIRELLPLATQRDDDEPTLWKTYKLARKCEHDGCSAPWTLV